MELALFIGAFIVEGSFPHRKLTANFWSCGKTDAVETIYIPAEKISYSIQDFPNTKVVSAYILSYYHCICSELYSLALCQIGIFTSPFYISTMILKGLCDFPKQF